MTAVVRPVSTFSDGYRSSSRKPDEPSTLRQVLLNAHLLNGVRLEVLLADLKSGALPFRADDYGANGASLVQLLLASRPLFQSLRSESVDELLTFLLDQGVDPFHDDADGVDALDLAACVDARSVLERTLGDPRAGDWTTRRLRVRSTAQLSDVPEIDLPWLHSAAFHQQSQLLAFLLARGANPNQTDAHGRTPLFYAHESLVETLIQAGADPSWTDANGWSIEAFCVSARRMGPTKWEAFSLPMGRRAAVSDPSASVASFMAMATNSSCSTLVAGLKRLKLTGAERHQGRSILEAAAERSFAASTAEYAQPQKATIAYRWLAFLLAHPPVQQAMTSVDRCAAALALIVLHQRLDEADAVLAPLSEAERQQGLMEAFVAASSRWKTKEQRWLGSTTLLSGLAGRSDAWSPWLQPLIETVVNHALTTQPQGPGAWTSPPNLQSTKAALTLLSVKPASHGERAASAWLPWAWAVGSSLPERTAQQQGLLDPLIQLLDAMIDDGARRDPQWSATGPRLSQTLDRMDQAELSRNTPSRPSGRAFRL